VEIPKRSVLVGDAKVLELIYQSIWKLKNSLPSKDVILSSAKRNFVNIQNAFAIFAQI